ncbi:MAG: LemA family protein [Planctomycetes bacterium]|nr:LemA family protein [Planctomycetota bacterium]
MAVLLIVAAAAVVLLFLVFGLYNTCVRLRNRVKNAWSQIDVQLKRRYDLVPNLVECVKKYMAHERETLTAVTEARSACMRSQGVKEQAQAENMLTGALKTLFAVSEAYPQLKADQNMMQLQEELTATENRIGFARQHYNDSVMQYNTHIQTVPAVFIAGLFRFEEAEFFELESAAERQVPKVQF